MAEITYKRPLDEQFGLSKGITKKTTGAGIQSSKCPWMKVAREEEGPEPSCIDTDWGTEPPLKEKNFYRLTKGGVCQSFRGLGHDENGLFVMCSVPPN